MKDLIKREGVEAVHIHNTLLLLSPAVVRAAKSCGVPVVQTLHNFRLFCPNGFYCGTVRSARSAPTTACTAL